MASTSAVKSSDKKITVAENTANYAATLQTALNGFSGFNASGQSSALQALISQLQSSTYKPPTSEQMQQQAEGEYQSYYDQLRLAAQQQKDTSDLALQQQREGLQTTYNKQREQSAETYANNYSAAGRQALSRGMQRSSYNNQTLANINSEAAKAQQTISDQQAVAEGDVDAQRTQLASQLAKQISQYSASQAADVLNRIHELEDQSYDRLTTSQQNHNTLAAQIYQMIHQEQQDTLAQQNWQAEFNENVRQFNASLAAKKTVGGSGGGGKPKPTPSGGSTTSYADLTALLSGGSSSASTLSPSAVHATFANMASPSNVLKNKK